MFDMLQVDKYSGYYIPWLFNSTRSNPTLLGKRHACLMIIIIDYTMDMTRHGNS